MATDATGTATSPDGIPTYNTSADAPSGLGFNAAMAAIQTALSARVLKSIATTAGDLLYATGASTLARLGVGSNGQVLTVVAGAPAWSTVSGGFTTLADVTLGSSSATIDSGVFSTSGYTHLLIHAALQDTGAGNPTTTMQFNADTTSSYYDERVVATNAVVSETQDGGATFITVGTHPGSGESTVWSTDQVDVPFSTVVRKHSFTYKSFNVADGTVPNMFVASGGGTYNVSAAISRVKFLTSGTAYQTGSRIVVLGY